MRQARLRTLATALIAAVLMGAAVGVAALDLDSILARSGYSATEKEAIQSILSQADQQKVPRDLLLPRLAEGVAKGARFQLTVDVLSSSLRSLERARTLLESLPEGRNLLADPAAWSITATLLETGAKEQEIQMLEDTAQGNSSVYRKAGFLHASLTSWGLSRQASLNVALTALRSKLPPDQYLGVVDVFEEGRQKRISPDHLAERVTQALSEAKDLDDLRRAVLY